MSGRSLGQVEAAAPGYAAFREPDPVPGPSARESLSNVVAWRADTWTRVAGGRVAIVEDDHGFYDGRPILWDRFVTWTMLERDDGAIVSMLSTHHMINPHKYPRQWGNPPLTRPEQYGQGMDVLLSLAASLAAHGPVLIAGDMNTHATYTTCPGPLSPRCVKPVMAGTPSPSTSSSTPSTSASPSLKAGQEPCSPTTPGSPPDSR